MSPRTLSKEFEVKIGLIEIKKLLGGKGSFCFCTAMKEEKCGLSRVQQISFIFKHKSNNSFVKSFKIFVKKLINV